jgi:hypothetical protein
MKLLFIRSVFDATYYLYTVIFLQLVVFENVKMAGNVFGRTCACVNEEHMVTTVNIVSIELLHAGLKTRL